MDELWRAEEALWTMGAAEARRRCHPSCVMAFASGLMQGEAVFAALERAPRWAAVEMTGRHCLEGRDGVVLGYHARARRPDGQRYEAFCTSTWVRQDAGWRLVQHQQTQPGG